MKENKGALDKWRGDPRSLIGIFDIVNASFSQRNL